MTVPAPDVTLAVVVARLDDVRGDLRAIRAELTASRSDMVPRGEWEQRNAHVDSRHREMGREIGDLRTEIRSRRMPWPSVVAAIAAVAAIVIALIR